MDTVVDWSNKTILVIDDSVTIRKGVEIFLGPTRAEVHFAIDGIDGVAKTVEVNPDIIFCDVLMPRMDGYQTCTAIKRHEGYGKIPVVLLSGKEGSYDKARGILAGADYYMTKPFSAEELIKVCTFFFDKKLDSAEV
jgi:twitching motility two-component system response regulator PilG